MFTFTLKIIFLLSCVLAVLGVVFAESFVHFLGPGATDKAIEYGITYTRVYAVFAPLMLISHATDNYLRVCGKEKLSMWISVGTQFFNIVLDIILIAFLHQGVWAAAFTSCLAMSLSSVIALWLFKNKKLDLYYCKGRIENKVFFVLLPTAQANFLVVFQCQQCLLYLIFFF